MRFLAIFLTSLAPVIPMFTPAASALQGSNGEPTVLFSSDEPLEVTLRMDVRTVIRDIDSLERQEHPAIFSYTDSEGRAVDLDVQVRTRGHFRRQRRNCNFPPIRLNFKKGQVAGTEFANQDKIKLVAHCQTNRSEYEQYILKEYLLYKTFNLLSDISYRVRLLRVTYTDTAGNEDDITKFGFLIEHEEELARRLGATYVEPDKVDPSQIEPVNMALVDVFQYMIGNTDWSAVMLHNIDVIEAGGVVYPVPFDYDWTGVVNARYAKPDPRLHTETVRDRLFRGFCRPADSYGEIIDFFNDRKEPIYSLYRNFEWLEERSRRDILEYFDEFYGTINNARSVRREFAQCE